MLTFLHLVPRKVLKDRYETAPEMDEPQQSELDMDQDELYDEDQFYKEDEAIPPAPKLQGAIPNAVYPFDFNMRSRETTTTLLPPILSRNESSLEGKFLYKIKKESFQPKLPLYVCTLPQPYKN